MDDIIRMGKLLLLIGLALIAAGCLPSQVQAATKTANTIADFADAAEAVLSARYKSDQEDCVQSAPARAVAESCITDVRERYAPAWKYYNNLRRAWLMLASAIQSAKLISDPNDPRLLPAAAELAKAQRGFEDLAGAIKVSK